MIQPHFCGNQGCRYSQQPVRHWCVRDGHYTTIAHGRVQRCRCRQCGRRCSAQNESMHYFAKRRVWLAEQVTPPVRSKVWQKRSGSAIPGYARSDLGSAAPQAQ